MEMVRERRTSELTWITKPSEEALLGIGRRPPGQPTPQEPPPRRPAPEPAPVLWQAARRKPDARELVTVGLAALAAVFALQGADREFAARSAAAPLPTAAVRAVTAGIANSAPPLPLIAFANAKPVRLPRAAAPEHAPRPPKRARSGPATPHEHVEATQGQPPLATPSVGAVAKVAVTRAEDVGVAVLGAGRAAAAVPANGADARPMITASTFSP